MKRTLGILGVVAPILVGCAATRPPNQLIDARVAYQQALSNPAAPLASTDMHEARQSLESAERAFQAGKIDEAKNFAYVAHRRTLSAQARAEALQAMESKRLALAEFERYREMQAVALRAELERAKGALSQAEQDAEAERQARVAAETKLSQIEGVDAARSERGLVLTISGSVLFPSGKSELFPDAKRRLSEVARALNDDERSILVVGHTDSQGSDEFNERLSEERADVVRSYLVSEGVEEGRIRSEGAGEAEPIADNATPEGRANNRRVEIILETTPGSGHVPTPKGEQGSSSSKAKEPRGKTEPSKKTTPARPEDERGSTPNTDD